MLYCLLRDDPEAVAADEHGPAVRPRVRGGQRRADVAPRGPRVPVSREAARNEDDRTRPGRLRRASTMASARRGAGIGDDREVHRLGQSAHGAERTARRRSPSPSGAPRRGGRRRCPRSAFRLRRMIRPGFIACAEAPMTTALFGARSFSIFASGRADGANRRSENRAFPSAATQRPSAVRSSGLTSSSSSVGFPEELSGEKEERFLERVSSRAATSSSTSGACAWALLLSKKIFSAGIFSTRGLEVLLHLARPENRRRGAAREACRTTPSGRRRGRRRGRGRRPGPA